MSSVPVGARVGQSGTGQNPNPAPVSVNNPPEEVPIGERPNQPQPTSSNVAASPSTPTPTTYEIPVHNNINGQEIVPGHSQSAIPDSQSSISDVISGGPNPLSTSGFGGSVSGGLIPIITPAPIFAVNTSGGQVWEVTGSSTLFATQDLANAFAYGQAVSLAKTAVFAEVLNGLTGNISYFSNGAQVPLTEAQPIIGQIELSGVLSNLATSGTPIPAATLLADVAPYNSVFGAPNIQYLQSLGGGNVLVSLNSQNNQFTFQQVLGASDIVAPSNGNAWGYSLNYGGTSIFGTQPELESFISEVNSGQSPQFWTVGSRSFAAETGAEYATLYGGLSPAPANEGGFQLNAGGTLVYGTRPELSGIIKSLVQGQNPSLSSVNGLNFASAADASSYLQSQIQPGTKNWNESVNINGTEFLGTSANLTSFISALVGGQNPGYYPVNGKNFVSPIGAEYASIYESLSPAPSNLPSGTFQITVGNQTIYGTKGEISSLVTGIVKNQNPQIYNYLGLNFASPNDLTGLDIASLTEAPLPSDPYAAELQLYSGFLPASVIGSIKNLISGAGLTGQDAASILQAALSSNGVFTETVDNPVYQEAETNSWSIPANLTGTGVAESGSSTTPAGWYDVYSTVPIPNAALAQSIYNVARPFIPSNGIATVATFNVPLVDVLSGKTSSIQVQEEVNLYNNAISYVLPGNVGFQQVLAPGSQTNISVNAASIITIGPGQSPPDVWVNNVVGGTLELGSATGTSPNPVILNPAQWKNLVGNNQVLYTADLSSLFGIGATPTDIGYNYNPTTGGQTGFYAGGGLPSVEILQNGKPVAVAGNLPPQFVEYQNEPWFYGQWVNVPTALTTPIYNNPQALISDINSAFGGATSLAQLQQNAANSWIVAVNPVTGMIQSYAVPLSVGLTYQAASQAVNGPGGGNLVLPSAFVNGQFANVGFGSASATPDLTQSIVNYANSVLVQQAFQKEVSYLQGSITQSNGLYYLPGYSAGFADLFSAQQAAINEAQGVASPFPSFTNAQGQQVASVGSNVLASYFLGTLQAGYNSNQGNYLTGIINGQLYQFAPGQAQTAVGEIFGSIQGTPVQGYNGLVYGSSTAYGSYLENAISQQGGGYVVPGITTAGGTPLVWGNLGLAQSAALAESTGNNAALQTLVQNPAQLEFEFEGIASSATQSFVGIGARRSLLFTADIGPGGAPETFASQADILTALNASLNPNSNPDLYTSLSGVIGTQQEVTALNTISIQRATGGQAVSASQVEAIFGSALTASTVSYLNSFPSNALFNVNPQSGQISLDLNVALPSANIFGNQYGPPSPSQVPGASQALLTEGLNLGILNANPGISGVATFQANPNFQLTGANYNAYLQYEANYNALQGPQAQYASEVATYNATLNNPSGFTLPQLNAAGAVLGIAPISIPNASSSQVYTTAFNEPSGATQIVPMASPPSSPSITSAFTSSFGLAGEFTSALGPSIPGLAWLSSGVSAVGSALFGAATTVGSDISSFLSKPLIDYIPGGASVDKTVVGGISSGLGAYNSFTVGMQSFYVKEGQQAVAKPVSLEGFGQFLGSEIGVFASNVLNPTLPFTTSVPSYELPGQIAGEAVDVFFGGELLGAAGVTVGGSAVTGTTLLRSGIIGAGASAVIGAGITEGVDIATGAHANPLDPASLIRNAEFGLALAPVGTLAAGFISEGIADVSPNAARLLTSGRMTLSSIAARGLLQAGVNVGLTLPFSQNPEQLLLAGSLGFAMGALQPAASNSLTWLKGTMGGATVADYTSASESSFVGKSGQTIGYWSGSLPGGQNVEVFADVTVNPAGIGTLEAQLVGQTLPLGHGSLQDLGLSEGGSFTVEEQPSGYAKGWRAQYSMTRNALYLSPGVASYDDLILSETNLGGGLSELTPLQQRVALAASNEGGIVGGSAAVKMWLPSGEFRTPGDIDVDFPSNVAPTREMIVPQSVTDFANQALSMGRDYYVNSGLNPDDLILQSKGWGRIQVVDTSLGQAIIDVGPNAYNSETIGGVNIRPLSDILESKFEITQGMGGVDEAKIAKAQGDIASIVNNTAIGSETAPGTIRLYGGYMGLGENYEETPRFVPGGKPVALTTSSLVEEFKPIAGESTADWLARLNTYKNTVMLAPNNIPEPDTGQIHSTERQAVLPVGSQFTDLTKIGTLMIEQEPEGLLGSIPGLNWLYTTRTLVPIWSGTLSTPIAMAVSPNAVEAGTTSLEEPLESPNVATLRLANFAEISPFASPFASSNASVAGPSAHSSGSPSRFSLTESLSSPTVLASFSWQKDLVASERFSPESQQLGSIGAENIASPGVGSSTSFASGEEQSTFKSLASRNSLASSGFSSEFSLSLFGSGAFEGESSSISSLASIGSSFVSNPNTSLPSIGLSIASVGVEPSPSILSLAVSPPSRVSTPSSQSTPISPSFFSVPSSPFSSSVSVSPSPSRSPSSIPDIFSSLSYSREKKSTSSPSPLLPLLNPTGPRNWFPLPPEEEIDFVHRVVPHYDNPAALLESNPFLENFSINAQPTDLGSSLVANASAAPTPGSNPIVSMADLITGPGISEPFHDPTNIPTRQQAFSSGSSVKTGSSAFADPAGIATVAAVFGQNQPSVATRSGAFGTVFSPLATLGNSKSDALLGGIGIGGSSALQVPATGVMSFGTVFSPAATLGKSSSKNNSLLNGIGIGTSSALQVPATDIMSFGTKASKSSSKSSGLGLSVDLSSLGTASPTDGDILAGSLVFSSKQSKKIVDFLGF